MMMKPGIILIFVLTNMGCVEQSVANQSPNQQYRCDGVICVPDPENRRCALVETKGNLSFINCGQEYDGPAYFINSQSGEIVAICGGALMAPNAPDRERCSFEALEAEGL